MRGPIIVSHGSNSSPQATKVSLLAGVADALGWATVRPDYRADDAAGLAAAVPLRLARLRAAMDAAPAPPVLVGSSLGAFVSALVSLDAPVAGLLLLATPGAIPGYPRTLDLRSGVPTLLVHGWRDEVCPLAGTERFAAARRLPFLVLDDDHRLGSSGVVLAAQLRALLDQVAGAA